MDWVQEKSEQNDLLKSFLFPMNCETVGRDESVRNGKEWAEEVRHPTSGHCSEECSLPSVPETTLSSHT